MNLVIGRFQPFHKGHEAIIRAALADGPTTVAIGSSQEGRTDRNPFTAAERRQMIHAVFPTVPVVEVPDIHDPPNWVRHVQSSVDFDAVFGNDDETMALFQTAGVRIVQPGLHLRSEWEGTRIRSWEHWEDSVPAAVVPLIQSFRASMQ